MKDKATLTFLVMIALFTIALLANLVFSAPNEKAYIELGQLKTSQKELTLENEKLRAEIKANSDEWHELGKQIQEIESELF